MDISKERTKEWTRDRGNKNKRGDFICENCNSEKGEMLSFNNESLTKFLTKYEKITKLLLTPNFILPTNQEFVQSILWLKIKTSIIIIKQSLRLNSIHCFKDLVKRAPQHSVRKTYNPNLLIKQQIESEI